MQGTQRSLEKYVYVVVKFYPWFKFYFLLFQTQYHTLPYPKAKGNNIKIKDKIEPQHLHSYTYP